jgi:hypothetical protein
VYLLLEKPDEHLKRNQFGLEALIRRRFEARGEPDEVKYPKPDRDPEAAAATLASYQASVDDLTGLSERLDLDNYLRWLALHSFFHCGDYADETFFYASKEQGSNYYRNLGWDTDDLFAECHHEARRAVRDAHALTYCAEAPLDHALVKSPELYRRYAETLAQLMREELDPERVADQLGQVGGELLDLLVDDQVCVGSVDLLDGQPATCARLRPALEADLSAFEANMRARAELLRQRLVEYGVEP